MKQKISKILWDFAQCKLSLDEATQRIFDLFVDLLDDEDSEIHKVGKEIAEMSDKEWEDNAKKIEEMLSRTKK
jgi:chromosome condensin MukBEF complex kleisin-like MukF subunit